MKYKLMFDSLVDPEAKKALWKLLTPTVIETTSKCEREVPLAFYFDGAGRMKFKVDKSDEQYLLYMSLRDLWVQSYIDTYRNVTVDNEDGMEWIKYDHVHKDVYVDLPEKAIIDYCYAERCTVEFSKDTRLNNNGGYESTIIIASLASY